MGFGIPFDCYLTCRIFCSRALYDVLWSPCDSSFICSFVSLLGGSVTVSRTLDFSLTLVANFRMFNTLLWTVSYFELTPLALAISSRIWAPTAKAPMIATSSSSFLVLLISCAWLVEVLSMVSSGAVLITEFAFALSPFSYIFDAIPAAFESR